MITRRDEPRRVTHYGAAPLRDHAGYTVEVGVEDGAGLLNIRVGLDGGTCHCIRADLDTAAVAELVERELAFLTDQHAALPAPVLAKLRGHLDSLHDTHQERK